MVKKTPVQININKDLSVIVNQVTVDISDSSPKAMAALKAIFRAPSEKEAQILKGAINLATPLIKRGKNSAISNQNGGAKSGLTRDVKKKEWDARVLETIQKLELKFSKDFKTPTWKEIAKQHKIDFPHEIASKSRIDRLRNKSDMG